jgi:hypothetical protein
MTRPTATHALRQTPLRLGSSALLSTTFAALL